MNWLDFQPKSLILRMMGKLATLVKFVETAEQRSILQGIMAPECAKVTTPRGIKITL